MTTVGGPNAQERERALIVRARSGDRDAVRELVDLHKDRLYGFIWRMVRNHHDAEDVCQDAFVKAFASLDSFCTDYRFSTWLFTIGYRICLNRLRRKRPLTGDQDIATLSVAADDGVVDVVESDEAARLRGTVWAAVDRLTPPQRAAVLLFYRQEFSCQDIARVLELPVATVKSHLHRARGRLREMLDSIDEQELHSFRNLAG